MDVHVPWVWEAPEAEDHFHDSIHSFLVSVLMIGLDVEGGLVQGQHLDREKSIQMTRIESS
jgi:hypothetical protein